MAKSGQEIMMEMAMRQLVPKLGLQPALDEVKRMVDDGTIGDFLSFVRSCAEFARAVERIEDKLEVLIRKDADRDRHVDGSAACECRSSVAAVFAGRLDGNGAE